MTLTSRQRVLRAVRREPVDCIPAAPFMYDLAAVVSGVRLIDYYTDARTLARAQLVLHELVGQDVISVGSDNYYIAEGFGCRSTRAKDELPALEQSPRARIEDVYDLQVPDPQSDGRMPLMLEAIREVRKAVGDEVAVRCPGTGPFALASYFIGTQNWLLEVGMLESGMDESKEPAIRHALELASEALIRFGKACFDAGADIIQCGDSLASCDVISPQTYARLALPYQQRVFRAWHEHGITAGLLHICGDSTSVLDRYADSGADLVEIDNQVDLGVARERIGRRTTLVGNVNTVTQLLQGTRAEVRTAAERCINLAGERGFILGSGCLVPRRTPLENIQEMVRTAHEHVCVGNFE